MVGCQPWRPLIPAGEGKVIRLAFTGAAIALSVIVAAPAHADTAERAYIKVLDDNNIHYGTRSHGLLMGHAVCTALEASEFTPETVVEALRRGERITYEDAAAVAAAAIVIFCPWDKS
jgi:hypothetical protein